MGHIIAEVYPVFTVSLVELEMLIFVFPFINSLSYTSSVCQIITADDLHAVKLLRKLWVSFKLFWVLCVIISIVAPDDVSVTLQ